MKKIIFSFLALSLIAGSAFSQKKIAKEEEAIKEALKKEISLWWKMDLDAESDFWLKEDYMTTVNTNGNNHGQNHGYDSIYAGIKRFFENAEDQYQYVSNIELELKDFNIKVFDNVAWAVYYTHAGWEFKGEPYDRSSVRVTFLEKVDGDWKMALNAITWLNPCEEEDEDGDDDDDE
jgi:hypothetical protein